MGTNTPTTRGKYRRFTNEFRLQVALEYKNGATVDDLQRKYEITPNQVYNWCDRNGVSRQRPMTDTQDFSRPIRHVSMDQALQENLRKKETVKDSDVKPSIEKTPDPDLQSAFVKIPIAKRDEADQIRSEIVRKEKELQELYAKLGRLVANRM